MMTWSTIINYFTGCHYTSQVYFIFAHCGMSSWGEPFCFVLLPSQQNIIKSFFCYVLLLICKISYKWELIFNWILCCKNDFCLEIPKLKNQSHFLENLVVAISSRYFSGQLSYFCSWYCMICLVMSISHQRLPKGAHVITLTSSNLIAITFNACSSPAHFY